MQVSVETTLKWLPFGWGGGNKPGCPVTVTAESTLDWVWQVAVSPPAPLESIWQAIMTQILSGWRINALLCQVFPVRKGAPLGPNASYKLQALFFFFFFARWLGTQNKATRSWDEELQRCASGFAGVHRHVRKRARTKKKKKLTENVFESGACGGVGGYFSFYSMHK